MGIRFTCPSGHKLHVKAHLAGKRGVCPHCGAKFVIPAAEEAMPSPLPDTGTSTAASRGEPFAAIGMEAASGIGSESIIVAAAENGPTAVERSAAPPPPPLVMEPSTAASPAIRYIAQRERSRRRQFNIAILLLVGVIVLALVLIFVLQRDTAPSSAQQPDGGRTANDWHRPCVALGIS